MNKAGGISLGVGAALVAALSVPVLAFASPAGAAGYPPPTLPASCSQTSAVLVVSQSGPVSTTLNAPENFKPGTPVTIIFNGNTVETITTPSNGVITLTFEANQTPAISINGSPYQPASYGQNTVDANGQDSTGGADGTQSCPFLITLDPGGTTGTTTTTTTSPGGTTTTTSSTIPGHTPTTTTTTSGSTTSTTAPTTTGTTVGGGSNNGSGGGGSNTGSGTSASNPTGNGSSPSSTGPLAFTGADLMALIIGGLVLLVSGTLIVLYARRRAAALTAS